MYFVTLSEFVAWHCECNVFYQPVIPHKHVNVNVMYFVNLSYFTSMEL
jgi:hypothetical protein